MDIQSRSDIEQLITRFYGKVTKDEVIGFIFNEVMQVNWEKHLPVMYDFWEFILLDKPVYQRNAMDVHFEVNKKVKLEAAHFDRWMEIFTGTVDELFSGKTAELAKKRARSVADLMLLKMSKGGQGLNIEMK